MNDQDRLTDQVISEIIEEHNYLVELIEFVCDDIFYDRHDLEIYFNPELAECDNDSKI